MPDEEFITAVEDPATPENDPAADLLGDDQDFDLVPMDSALMELDASDEDEPALKLPSFEDITDDKIIKSMREEYKGFTFDENAEYDKMFVDVDQLSVYVQESLKDIQNTKKTGEVGMLQNNARAMARMWVTGMVVEKTLKKATYGKGASNKLAAKLHKSIAYVYQLRSYYTGLTLQQMYLLGIRMCSATDIRHLALLKDRLLAKTIIETFIKSTSDVTDRQKIEQAKKALKSAINKAIGKTDAQEQLTSDPQKSEAPKVTAEYDAALNAIRTLRKSVKQLADMDWMEKTLGSCSDFYLMSSVEGAEEHLAKLKEEAAMLQKEIEASQTNLADALNEVQSLQAVDLQ